MQFYDIYFINIHDYLVFTVMLKLTNETQQYFHQMWPILYCEDEQHLTLPEVMKSNVHAVLHRPTAQKVGKHKQKYYTNYSFYKWVKIILYKDGLSCE